MKKYKFITIKEDGEHDNHPMFGIFNNKSNEKLGILYFYKGWNQYVFSQWERGIIFNDTCMKDIMDYLSILKK